MIRRFFLNDFNQKIIRILDNVFQKDTEILYTLQLRYKIC